MVERKILDVKALVTTTTTLGEVREVKNKIHTVSDLVKKTDYNAEMSDIGTKYFTTSDHNKFTSEILGMNIKEKRLVHKFAIYNVMKNYDLNTKLTALATKGELKLKQNIIGKLQAFDSSCFCSKSHFEDDSMQKYVVFQSVYRYFKKIVSSDHISTWKSKGFFNESIKPSAASNSLVPASNYINT